MSGFKQACASSGESFDRRVDQFPERNTGIAEAADLFSDLMPGRIDMLRDAFDDFAEKLVAFSGLMLHLCVSGESWVRGLKAENTAGKGSRHPVLGGAAQSYL